MAEQEKDCGCHGSRHTHWRHYISPPNWPLVSVTFVHAEVGERRQKRTEEPSGLDYLMSAVQELFERYRASQGPDAAHQPEPEEPTAEPEAPAEP